MQVKSAMRYQRTLVRMAIIENYKQQMLERVWSKENSLRLLMGIYIGVALYK